MNELTIADVVLILKPLCESFMNEPSSEKAAKIILLVNRTSNTLIQKICENILYPITYHLKKSTLNKDENLKLIETIRTVILKIRIENLKLFYEIYHCLRTQICKQNNSLELIETHEELKEVVVLCLKDLIKNCSINIIESFYTRQQAALLSHGIYLCVKIARLEKSISLRLNAIEAVMTLLQVHDEADSQDIVLRNQIADVIMLYIPGVASGLLEVALSSDILNHKITVMAIRTWSRAIALVMQDFYQEEEKTELLLLENIKINDKNNIEKMKHILETAKRTPEWYCAVSEKFKVIFIELDALTNHSHFKVRKELAEGVGLLLLTCARNMKSCFQTLLDILITLSEDENSQVADKSREILQKVQNKCIQDKNMKSAVELLEENLYDLLTKMPRIIRTSGELLQLVWLNRLAGYLKVLSEERLSPILLSTAHLQKLLLTLVYISELDFSDVSLLEDYTVTNFEEINYHEISYSWKQFKFLFDSVSIRKLYSIFKILGEFGNHEILVNNILKMMFDMPKFKKELTLILNTILEVPADHKIQMRIYKQVIEYYIIPENWNLPTKVSEEVTFQMVQNNIIQCCLFLDGLGIISKVLQEEFQYFLLKTLYLVIEKAGSKHSLLRSIGLSNLEIIAKSQKLNSVRDLLKNNVDYITYHVTLKLRRVERNPGVLDVIEVVTKYSTLDFLPHLKDIVDDLLLQSSSNVQKRNIQSFLKVFYAFIICVRRIKFNKNFKSNEEYFNALKTLKPVDVVIDSFLKYYEANRNSKLFDSDKNFDENLLNNFENTDISEDYNACDTNEDENEIKVPYFVNMIRDIMKRCLHYLPSQNVNESTLAMLTLKEGIYILEEWENELLPIVHEVWHPLVQRFKDPNPLIINQAWQLLCCLAQVSKDFIRSRTLKQILPTLMTFLKKSSKESLKKDSGSTYKYTQTYKLQKEILFQLGKLVKNLKLLEKEIWNILDVAELYLDCLQNVQLQQHCVNLYIEISEYNPDIVWIKCIDIWNRLIEPVICHNDLNMYIEVIDCKVKNNYQENVQNILNCINEKYKIL